MARLTERQIINHAADVVGIGAKSSYDTWVMRKRATQSANVAAAHASLRESGCRVTERVRKIVAAELLRIETEARQFKNEVFYFLALAAQKKQWGGLGALLGLGSDSGETRFYFTKVDYIGCQYFPNGGQDPYYRWNHNGVRIDEERAFELVPSASYEYLRIE